MLSPLVQQFHVLSISCKTTKQQFQAEVPGVTRMECLLTGKEGLRAGGCCQWIHGHQILTHKALLLNSLQFLCSHILASCTSSPSLSLLPSSPFLASTSCLPLWVPPVSFLGCTFFFSQCYFSL